jgi:hypothetical protein
MSEKDSNDKVEDAFKQLDGALCIWARAKGETPLKQYFHQVTPNVRRVLIGETVYQMILTVADEEDQKK